MNREYYTIKDECRKGLLKYLEKAISRIPPIEKPYILDAGCGSGVPTLFIAEKFDGKTIAIDSDSQSIAFLSEKVTEMNLVHRVNPFCCSLFDLKATNQFDLIVAEGLLNVIGFQNGFLMIVKLLKRNGFIIIHDELRDQHAKKEHIESNNFKIMDSIVLDEQIWWNDYYKCLEKEIGTSPDKEFLKLFSTDLLEIESFKKDSSQYNSIYYVINRN